MTSSILEAIAYDVPVDSGCTEAMYETATVLSSPAGTPAWAAPPTRSVRTVHMASDHVSAHAEYVADQTGFELLDMAVGSSTTNKSTSFHGVGDFYPSSLLSNKRGARNVTLPTFNEAVES